MTPHMKLDEKAIEVARDAYEGVTGEATSLLALRHAITAYLSASHAPQGGVRVDGPSDTLEFVDAVKTLLYSDEVFVGTHWDSDFRAPDAKSWPTFCAHFPNYGADAEEIVPEGEVIRLARLVREHGPDAVTAWVCHRRGMTDPPKGRLSEAGRAALSALTGSDTQREAPAQTTPRTEPHHVHTHGDITVASRWFAGDGE